MERYENYKDSGIEWIGEIPEHWKVSPIKHIAHVSNGSTPKSSVDEYWDGNIHWVTTDDLGKLKSRYIKKTRRTITIQGFHSCGTNLSPIGSVVISTRAPIGHLGILEIEACTNQGCKSLIFENFNSEFCYYFLHISKEILDSQGQGSTFKELSTSALKEFKIVSPNIREQLTIAAYLNEKTSEIDSLIAKKKKLISLLKEERTAIINKAVTKGINPNAKYKDSGIEWIGEIPEHWEVRRLKHVVKSNLKYGANEPAEYDNIDFPRYIRITDFGNDGKLKESTFKSLPFKRAEHYMLENGDLLFARSGATVGKTFLFKDYNGLACFAGYLIKASFDKLKINSTLINYFTKSTFYENWVESMFQQATIQNIGADKYNQLRIVVPLNISEQDEIVEYLDKKTREIDIIISKTEKEIALIKEYKSALINDVVTGKINVTDAIVQNQDKLQEAHQ